MLLLQMVHMALLPLLPGLLADRLHSQAGQRDGRVDALQSHLRINSH